VVPCLVAIFLIGLVLPAFYAVDDDGMDPAAMPATVAVDTRPPDRGMPLSVEPAERTGATSVARREIERGPPRS
jgi:hypothetical protein